MKKRTLLTLASIYIACSGYAQQQTEPSKIDRIKKDPVSYQNNGGVIDSDQMVEQPEKMEKVTDPNGQFVIYRNSDQERINGGVDYKMIKDQTSEEYKLLKQEYLRNHPVIEPAEQAVPRSAEERTKIYNKK